MSSDPNAPVPPPTTDPTTQPADSGIAPASAPAPSGVSPVSATEPVNPEPSKTSDPAFVPSPHQQAPGTENQQPWQTPEFKKKVAAAGFPGSPQADDAFLAALHKFGSGGESTTPPTGSGPAATTTPPASTTTPTASTAAAPAISSISPTSTPANVDCVLTITGTGFDPGASVQVGANLVTPSLPPSATSITVTIPAANISIAGSVPISVNNPNGQGSNSQALTLS